MLCPNCETENRDGAKFCDECGFPLSGAIARAAQGTAYEADTDDNALSGATSVIDPTEADDAEHEETMQGTEAVQPISDDVNSEDFEPANDADDARVLGDVKVSSDEDNSQFAEHDDQGDELEASETRVINTELERGDFDSDKTAVIGRDLSGFDRSFDYGERIAGPDEIPQASFRDGGTMQMPRIEGDEAPKSRDFLASSTTKQKKTARKVAIAVIGVVVIAAAIVFATYQMQLWGGKAVPNVKGLTQVDATSILEDNGFVVRTMEVKSDDTEGLVLISDPEAGSRVDDGSEIVIHVATARIIPDIVGKQEDKAKELLDEEGFENVKFEKQKSDETAGMVLSVTPEKGKRALSTNEIVVKVADPYIVPDVTNMYLDEARAAIEDAGLTSEVVYVYSDTYADGTIVGTDPVAGTQVTGDTVVAINLAQSKAVLLEGYVNSLLAPGQTVNIGSVSYEIQSLNSVSYIGNNTVTYSATARPYAVVLGERAYLGTVNLQGQVVFDNNNQFVSIS